LILAAICCGFVLLFSACQLVDNLHDYKQWENGDIPEPEEQVVQQPLTIGPAAEEKEDAAAEQAQPAVGEQVEIELYFMNGDGSALEKETDYPQRGGYRLGHAGAADRRAEKRRAHAYLSP
ncbi:MAG: hypothetical protein IIZ45_02025, partial [Firmicutes bacterium]|nr:hypothetical protein [Bacillota bacterium]